MDRSAHVLVVIHRRIRNTRIGTWATERICSIGNRISSLLSGSVLRSPGTTCSGLRQVGNWMRPLNSQRIGRRIGDPALHFVQIVLNVTENIWIGSSAFKKSPNLKNRTNTKLSFDLSHAPWHNLNLGNQGNISLRFIGSQIHLVHQFRSRKLRVVWPSDVVNKLLQVIAN